MRHQVSMLGLPLLAFLVLLALLTLLTLLDELTAELPLPGSPRPEGPSIASATPAPSFAPRAARRPPTIAGPRRQAPRTSGISAEAPRSERADEAVEPEAMAPDAGLHLDRAPRAIVRQTLERAVDRARVERALVVAPEVVDLAVEQRRVGIIFATGSGAEISQAAFASLLSGPAADARWAGLRLFPLLDHGAVSVGPQALLQLIGSDRIHRIELDVIHRPVLATSVPQIRADLAHRIGADGDGQAIAILDTGIDPEHPMLAGRVVDEACFSLDRDCPNGASEMLGPGAGAPCSFGCGHGTLVAGIAAGDDPEGRLVGVAPGAQLISIQVFSDIDGAPGAYASDVLAGLQHVLALTAYYPIAVVNLSMASERLFGSSQSCDEAIGSQRLAIERLREVGVASVAAAGNDARSDQLAAPACLSNVTSVGSSSLRDRLSGFSNSASFLSLLAPGEGIESSREGGSTGLTSGTSMATAHVAGAIALLREATPSATVVELENALALTGIPIRVPGGGGGDLTVPRIDVEAARALLAATIEPSPEPVAGEQEDGDGFTGAAAPSGAGGGGGGGGCGLIGIEPFAVLLLLRLPRTRRAAASSASS